MNGYTEAWCLSFNQHLGRSLLVPADVSKDGLLSSLTQFNDKRGSCAVHLGIILVEAPTPQLSLKHGESRTSQKDSWVVLMHENNYISSID